MKKFFRIYFQAFYRPAKAFESVLQGNYFSAGFRYMLIPLGLYTLMYVMLFLGRGAPSTFTPWLNISKENYYFWNQFLVAPGMLLSWFAAAAYMQVAGHAMKGKGSFEAMLSLTGLSISVAMWSTLLHDLLMSFFSMVRVIDAHQHEIAMNTPTVWRAILWTCFVIYFFAFPALFYRTVRAVHSLGRAASLFTAITGFIVFQLIFLIFNR
ncbi:MAG: hypothetical protein WCK92_14345 [Bacteroidota bacterium]